MTAQDTGIRGIHAGSVQPSWIVAFMVGFAIVMAVAWSFTPQPDQDVGVAVSTEVQPDVTTTTATSPARKIHTPSIKPLLTRFQRMGYDLNLVRAREMDVPRVLADAVPHDLGDINETDRRKSAFLSVMLPLVLVANERIEHDRDRLLAINEQMKAGEKLSGRDAKWLDAMFQRYKVKDRSVAILLRRVDVVPPSMALAQAAIESGWGTSRFAREGNALFGQWTFGKSSDGLVPDERDDGKDHKVRAFGTPLEAVASYIQNLNTHRAYRNFRIQRAKMRASGDEISGMTLAATLKSYSEKGEDYVKLVRSIIASNELQPLDEAKLAGSGDGKDSQNKGSEV